MDDVGDELVDWLDQGEVVALLGVGQDVHQVFVEFVISVDEFFQLLFLHADQDLGVGADYFGEEGRAVDHHFLAEYTVVDDFKYVFLEYIGGISAAFCKYCARHSQKLRFKIVVIFIIFSKKIHQLFNMRFQIQILTSVNEEYQTV